MSEFDKHWNERAIASNCPEDEAKIHFEAGQQSKQAEIDICEKLRDSQFDKLWNLTQAIEVARNGADEDFDLFLNHLSNILKGE